MQPDFLLKSTLIRLLIFLIAPPPRICHEAGQFELLRLAHDWEGVVTV